MKIKDTFDQVRGEFSIKFFDKNGVFIKEEIDNNLIVTSARNIMPVLMNAPNSTIYDNFKVGVIELGFGGHTIVSDVPTTAVPTINDEDITTNYTQTPYDVSIAKRITFSVGDDRIPTARGISDTSDNSTREIIVTTHEDTTLAGFTNRITYSIRLSDNDTELNGAYISEAGLFTSHYTTNPSDPTDDYYSDTTNRMMFSHKCFGGFEKTSDFICQISWSVIF